jgi:hypothetical protein
MYIIPPLYIMGGRLRKKFRFMGVLGGGSRKVFWPSSGTGLGTSRVPELASRFNVGHIKFLYRAGTPACPRTRCVGTINALPTSDSGRVPRRVPELGQKTFRLPPPEWGSNRNFLRRLPPIMYKGGIMYADKKGNSSDSGRVPSRVPELVARSMVDGSRLDYSPYFPYVTCETGAEFRYRAGNRPCPRLSVPLSLLSPPVPVHGRNPARYRNYACGGHSRTQSDM